MPNSPIATGSQTRLSLVRETAFGVIPVNPAFKQVRPGSLAFEPKPKYTQSKEIRSDQMRAGYVLVGKDVTGKYDFELSPRTHDDVIESALRTTRVATPEIVKVGAEIGAVAAAGVFNTAAGLGNPYKTGHLVKASGFANAANVGVSRVTANNANNVTLGGLATAVEAVPPAGARLKVIGLRGAANGSITTTAGAQNKVSVATTDPATLGLAIGMWFRASGFAGADVVNNGWYRVSGFGGAGPFDIICDIVPTGFATTAAAGQTISLFYSDYMRPGVTRTSYVAEEAHLDIAKFKYAKGQVVNKLDMKLTTESIIDCTAEFVGTDGDWAAQAAGATYAPKSTNDPLNTSANLGACYVNGAWVQGVITGASLSIVAGAIVDKALGVFGAADVHYGAWALDGTLEKYFLDTVIAALVMAGQATGVVIPVLDPILGDGYVFDIRRTKLMDGNNPAVQNADDALKEPYKFMAEVDPTVGYVLHVQCIEAVS